MCCTFLASARVRPSATAGAAQLAASSFVAFKMMKLKHSPAVSNGCSALV
jgi:hypothetical protein